MEQKRIDRSSNFELLRVVAMIMIIIHHIFMHCIRIQLTDITSIERMGNGFFNNPVVYRRLWLADFGAFMGPLGNALFILITGYFMVEKDSVDIVKISKKLLLRLIFASVALTCGSFLLYRVTGANAAGIAGLVKITDFNETSWFVGYYFMLVLIGKLFLNRWLSGLSARQYREFLIIIFALIEFKWTGLMLENLFGGLRVLITGVFLYSVAGYIRKYDPLGRIRISAAIACSLFIVFIMCVSAYNVRVENIEQYRLKGGGGGMVQKLTEYYNWSLPVLVTAILMFELFRRMKAFKSRLVNYLGASTFMVYIIHDNNVFRSLWARTDWISLWYRSTSAFMLNILKWTAAVFVIGVAAHMIYIFLYDHLLGLKRFFISEK